MVATKVFRQEVDACDGNDSVLVAEGMGTIEVTWCNYLGMSIWYDFDTF